MTIDVVAEVREGSLDALGYERSDLEGKDVPTLLGEARWHREQAQHLHTRSLEHWVEMGRRLLEAKARLPHGEFVVHVQDEVGVDRVTAWKAMAVSRNVARLEHLPATIGLNAAVEVVQEHKRAERRANRRDRVPPLNVDMHVPACDIEIADAGDLPLPDECVDLIVTSPPYGLGVEYEDTDDDQGYSVYQAHMAVWAAEMHRVSAPNGRLCLNVPLDVTYRTPKPLYADWVTKLRDNGWQYRSTVVWNEGNISKSVARGSVDSPTAPHTIARVEMIAIMHKGEWSLGRDDDHDLTHAEWLNWTNGLWSFVGENRDMGHPTPFPEELPRRLMKLFSFRNDVVLDPFIGSGTTAVVGVQLGRRIYGFDHSPRYVQQARQRLEQLTRVVA